MYNNLWISPVAVLNVRDPITGGCHWIPPVVKICAVAKCRTTDSTVLVR